MLKAYAFDIDSNILFTDTKIILEKKWENGIRTPIEVSQDDYGKLMQDREHYRFINNKMEDSMRAFRAPGKLKQTFFDAIENKRLWPSYPKYKQAHREANPICENTARGHPVKEFRDTNRAFIYEVLEDDERDELIYNMRQHLWSSAPKRKDSLINIFLDNNFYWPCANKEFLKSIDMSFANPTPERKKAAFEKFLHHINRVFVSYYWKEFVDQRKISVGFSDDLKVNILGMQNHIINDLMNKFPEIKFCLYDTSDPDNIDKQIVRK